MARMTESPHRLDPRRVMVVRPRRKRKRGRFNWELAAAAVALLIGIWIINHVEPSITWNDVMDSPLLHVQNKERYTQLATLGVLLTGICVIGRILRGKDKGE